MTTRVSSAYGITGKSGQAALHIGGVKISSSIALFRMAYKRSAAKTKIRGDRWSPWHTIEED
jgi:hypothetical protein